MRTKHRYAGLSDLSGFSQDSLPVPPCPQSLAVASGSAYPSSSSSFGSLSSDVDRMGL
jgi:hypothetical protein